MLISRSRRIACVAALIALPLPAARAADADALVGIHFWGDANDATPATMLDSVARGAYSLETINTHNPQWSDVAVADALFGKFRNDYNVTPVTRLGYYWGNTLAYPGAPIHPAPEITWPQYIASSVVSPLKDKAHVWQLGNEPNLHGEATNWANQQIPPATYAQVYRDVRNAISAPALHGQAGAHRLLVAPVSPGGVVPGVRYMDGGQYLDQVLAAIPANEVDGVALHSYGGQPTARGSFQDFRKGLLDQIAVIDNRNLSQVPLYLTEWNRATQIGNAADEAVTADFARQSLKFLDRWNRTPGNHNIVSANWFVYDSPGNDGTGWDTYSIEYWKTHGGGGAGDLYQAFHDVARAGYKAGIAGTRPLPQGVQIFDDFEINDGRFAGSTPAPGVAGTSGTQAAGSFKVRQNDTDSYTLFHGQKIGIADDPANPAGWSARYVSGSGLPANNVPITLTSGLDGNVGFFLRLYTLNGSENVSGATGLTVQITLDSGSGGGINTDAGVPRPVIADGDWHFYEWSLDTPADWTAWPVTASDGLLGTSADFLGPVSLDSILFNGPHGTSVEYILDTVMRNNNGSLNVMTGIPEPGGIAIILPAGIMVTARRRRLKSACARLSQAAT